MEGNGREGFSGTVTVVWASVEGEGLLYPIDVWIVMSNPVEADEKVCLSKVKNNKVSKVRMSINVHV